MLRLHQIISDAGACILIKRFELDFKQLNFRAGHKEELEQALPDLKINYWSGCVATHLFNVILCLPLLVAPNQIEPFSASHFNSILFLSLTSAMPLALMERNFL